VTAGLGQLPPPLIEQLKVGGRLVMPVWPAYTTQHLTVVEKIAPGKTTMRAVALFHGVFVVPDCSLVVNGEGQQFRTPRT
jgi:protein-L-isoaspartate O-methyltransferase